MAESASSTPVGEMTQLTPSGHQETACFGRLKGVGFTVTFFNDLRGFLLFPLLTILFEHELPVCPRYLNECVALVGDAVSCCLGRRGAQ
jgi:hypothetical protein